jgi:DnaJ-class molecular chaperone
MRELTETEVACSKCNGSGTIIEFEIVGYRYGDLSSSDCTPELKPVDKVCKKCNGRGAMDWVRNITEARR